MAASEPARSRHSSIGNPNICSAFIVPGRKVPLGTAGYQNPKRGALLDVTVSDDGCSGIRTVGDSVARHHSNEEDYTGGKGLGQARDKGRIPGPFLDTPNDHILFWLYRMTAHCVGISAMR